MKKIVIVSKELRHIIPIDKDFPFQILYSKDIGKEINHQLEQSSEDLIFIFICITLNEFGKVLKTLDDFPNNRIIYSLCLWDSVDGECPDAGKIELISNFRTTSPSPQEFKFLCSKAFLQIEEAYRERLDKDESMITLMDMKRDQEDLDKLV